MSTLATWRVPSRSRPEMTHLVVRLPDGDLICTCEAASYGRMCRHRLQVLMMEEEPMSVTKPSPQRLPSTMPVEWDGEEQRIIREQVAGGMTPAITDAELRYFASVCQARGLNPIAGQIVPVRRGGRMVIQVTIHGLRAIADATGNYAPGPLTTFTTNADGGLVSASASVLKYAQGTWHVVAEVASFDEYCEHTREGRPQGLWGTKPRVMLAKCAEALALRRAFPVQLGGLYVDAELAQTGADIEPVAPPPPPRPAAARPSQPAPSAASGAGERPDFNAFWASMRNSGWDSETLQAAARDNFGKPVAQLSATELAALKEAALGALLVAGADGVWRIQSVGEVTPLDIERAADDED